jgi:hypothetical protein
VRILLTGVATNTAPLGASVGVRIDPTRRLDGIAVAPNTVRLHQAVAMPQASMTLRAPMRWLSITSIDRRAAFRADAATGATARSAQTPAAWHCRGTATGAVRTPPHDDDTGTPRARVVDGGSPQLRRR